MPAAARTPVLRSTSLFVMPLFPLPYQTPGLERAVRLSTCRRRSRGSAELVIHLGPARGAETDRHTARSSPQSAWQQVKIARESARHRSSVLVGESISAVRRWAGIERATQTAGSCTSCSRAVFRPSPITRRRRFDRRDRGCAASPPTLRWPGSASAATDDTLASTERIGLSFAVGGRAGVRRRSPDQRIDETQARRHSGWSESVVGPSGAGKPGRPAATLPA